MNGVAALPWLSVARSEELGLYCAIASGVTNSVMTSPDGLNWAQRLAISGAWKSICWSKEKQLFIAVGYGGACMTSPDGIVWTSRATGNTRDWSDVIWAKGPGLFIACEAVSGSGTSTQAIMTSIDGITWTLRTTPSVSLKRLAASETLGIIVAVGIGGGIISSPDGVTWTMRASPSGTTNWSALDWNATLGCFLAAGTSGVVITSGTGLTWTVVTTSGLGTGAPTDICWIPDLNLYILLNNAGISTSPNGITWTLRYAVTYSALQIRWIAWSPSVPRAVVVAQTGAGSNQVIASNDALTWSSSPDDFNIAVTGIDLDQSAVEIEPTQGRQLTATVSPANATNKTVSYLSSNSEIATVNSAGLVTGIAEGTATITVTTHDGGFTATCTVTVGDAPPVRRLMYIIKL